MLRKQFLETSRGRIAALLQRGSLTSEEMASKLGLTPSAVRAQLAGMERDGLVRRAGEKRGTTRPSHVFELTAEVEQLLSGAYVPLLTNLVEALSRNLRGDQLKRLMRESGKALADELPVPKHRPGSLESRVATASHVLNTQLGAVTHVVRKNGGFLIRGFTCPVASLTDKHPSVCLYVESIVREIVGGFVRECCDRSGRPRCCFEIKPHR